VRLTMIWLKLVYQAMYMSSLQESKEERLYPVNEMLSAFLGVINFCMCETSDQQALDMSL
jgi:hypothetical protein